MNGATNTVPPATPVQLTASQRHTSTLLFCQPIKQQHPGHLTHLHSIDHHLPSRPLLQPFPIVRLFSSFLDPTLVSRKTALGSSARPSRYWLPLGLWPELVKHKIWIKGKETSFEPNRGHIIVCEGSLLSRIEAFREVPLAHPCLAVREPDLLLKKLAVVCG